MPGTKPGHDAESGAAIRAHTRKPARSPSRAKFRIRQRNFLSILNALEHPESLLFLVIEWILSAFDAILGMRI
jgi:hypothetical protein